MTSTVSKERFAIPASFAQERLWFLAQMDPGDPAYQISGAVKFKGSLNIAALESSLSQIVQRHESLRTTFRLTNDSLMQVISPEGTIELEVIRSADDGDDTNVTDQLATMARQSFDIETGPLVRFTLLRTAPDCHFLLLVIHHIIADGWSLMILIRELMELYKASISGLPAQLPALPIQYADYSHWQRKLLDNGRLQAALEYWKTKLADLEPTVLPFDYVRSGMERHAGSSLSLALDESLARDLVRLAQREKTTLFMVLLAVFKILLHRHTGEAEIVVGVPVAGRRRIELERLIGCFLNIVVLRTRVSHDDSFQQLLKRVREVALEAYSYEDVPFETVLAALNEERSDKRSSLFHVFFNMINLPEALEIELPGLTAELIDLPESNSKFDLTLYVRHKREGIVLELVYDIELFSRERMREVLAQFESLLRCIVSNTNSAIGSFSLVTAEAVKLLPNVSEPLSSGWPGSVCDLFRTQVQRVPNRIAVADTQVAWTYSELETISSKIASYLLGLGLERQSVVAIYAHRSAPLVASLLGIMRAGFAFLILDPAYPAARLAEYVRLARARALIHLDAAGSLPGPVENFFTEAAAPILLLPASAKWKSEHPLNEVSQDCPAAPMSPDDIAYIAFTSGSTGKPKGIAGRHRSLSHFAPLWIEKFGLTEKDRFSMLSGLSHDPLHRDVFLALMAGAAVCIPDDDWKLAGHAVRWLQEAGISVMNLTPAIGQVITTGAAGSDRSLERLRYIFFVGDSLTRHEVLQFRKFAPGVTCVNLYGATETQQALASYTVTTGPGPASVNESNGHMPQREIVPLGKGFKDVQLVLLNRTGQLCGVGELGEIYFRSPHLAAGYVDDPELTAERFVAWPNPSNGTGPNNKDNARFYKTGDLGRYLPGGDVEPAGRKDSQVKIRGFRVELAEVEAVLKQHPRVHAAAVVALNESEDRYLAAYVVLESKGQRWEKELFRFVSDRLPNYMVPASFVSLDTLPLLPTGKIDRRALPGIKASRIVVEQDRGAHQEDEEILAGIFAEALQRGHLGVHDNFFEAGGHSLLTIRVLSRVREVFGVELPHRAIFDEPTAAGLARRIRADRNTRVEPPTIKTISRDRAIPLSFAQQRLWFLQQLQPDSTAYNMLFGVRLSGRMDKAALQRSLDAIVQRHEILRTTFKDQDGIPVQNVQPSLELKVDEVSLDQLSLSAQEQEVQRYRGLESQLAFDLQNGPLLRVRLIRLAGEEHVVLMTMHHIVGDAWSTGVIIQELSRAYAAYASGLPPSLPPLPIQYADFAAWQREWLQGEVLQRQVSHWREQLSNITTLELPLDRPRPALMSQQGAAIHVSLPSELTTRLQHLARREGSTLFMTMLASWQLLLARYSGQEDIAIGAPVAGRKQSELGSLIGFFVNTLVLRTHVSRSLSIRELLQQVRARCLEAFDYEDVPFEKIVEELQPERDLSRQPFFQVMFGLQTTPQYELDLPGLKFTPLPQGQDLIAAKFDLTLLLAESGQGIQGRLEYVPDLFDQATIETLIRRWQIVLQQVTENPELGIARISLMSDAERMELERGASDFLLNHEPHQTLVSLLSIHAQQNPGAIAVVEEGNQLNYGELNQLANQWAHLLIQLGIRQGDHVIVRLERVTDVMQVSLGVLKCGAVLVGLDCFEPGARTRTIFELARARVAITSELITDSDTVGSTSVFVVDELRKNIAQEKPESLQVESRNNSPACILYRPDPQGCLRGVVLSQNALCEPRLNVNARQTECPLERIALAFSFAHETTSLELFHAVSRGDCLVSLPVRRPLPPRKLAAVLRDQRVTELHTSVSVLQRMTREFPAALKGVQRIICEEAPDGLATRKQALAAEVIERSYGGLAFSAAGGLWLRYGISSLTAEGRVPGFELPAETRMYLLALDQQMELVPDGVLGEMYLSSPALALNYESRPAESALDFVPDPFSSVPGSRMYRTGELAWRRSDGSLHLRGRRDGRWTICGMQVVAREIENALLLHPDVSEAAVLLPGLHAKKNAVMGIVVPAAGRQVVAQELSEFLRVHAPEKMLPENIFQADEIPRSSYGEVDYSALRKLIDKLSGAAVEYVAPRNPIEEELASIWAEMFVKDRVGIHDNFFQLGGHSLLATQVIAHINDVLHIELPLRRLFEAPTVAELAQVVEQLVASGSRDRTPKIARVSREHPLPLSFAQQRLWFLDQLQPGSAAYNLRVAIRLSGELNREALISSLQHIVRRHESLRASFTAHEGAAVQIIATDLKLEIEEIDLQGHHSREEQEQAFNQHVHAEAVTAFDLTSAPLARVKLVEFAKDEHALLVTMHHIIGDAWSLGILVKEFSHLYAAYILGKQPELPELPLQYADYAVWQRAWLQGDVLDRQLGYWRNQLAGIPVLNLPTDRSRPAVMSQRGASVWLKVNPELTEALRGLSQSRGVTLFMTLVASFQFLLSRYSGQSDISVGTPIAGRTRTETEGLIGFFINTLVLRARIREHTSFRQLLDHVRNLTLEAYDHQDVPFEKLVDELQPDRDLSRQPFFQVMFALQKATQGNMELPGLRLSRIESHEAQPAKFDLTMLLEENEQDIEGHLEYTPDLFDQKTIESLVERWQLILEQVVKQDETPLAYICLLREGERDVLCGWKGREQTRHPEPIGAMIAAHARSNPSAIAVVAGGQELSWQKLHVKSNQWAHYLRKHGVRAGTTVGVCLPGSVDLAAITMAVLKCGAILAGLDADETQSRLQQILRSSEPEIVITQERSQKDLNRPGARLILVDRLEKEIAAESQSGVIENAEAHWPACILHRSSRLGYPVGILVPHQALLNVEWLRDFGCAELDRIGQEIGFNAELASLEWLQALVAGICVVDVPSRPVLAPRKLANLIRAHRITFLWISAASLETLGREFPTGLKGVKKIFCREAGSRMPWLGQTLKKDVLDRVFAVQGSDEAGGSWRMHPIDATAAGNSSEIHALELRSGTALYVLDSQLEPAPQGVVGEIYVGGGTLATEYHAEPQLTAHTFVPDPFSDVAGSRLYRTGELARRRSDGRMELCGRQDGRMMADGIRIHAEELEAVLRQHSTVSDAAVVMHEGRDRQAERMVAVIMKSEKALSIDDVGGFVEEKLSKVMRPSAIVELERIPRNFDGEIDRNAVTTILRQRDAAMATPEYEPPRNEIERTLCAIWEEVLSVSNVGINDNFFKRGGDSILSIQVIARARQAGIGLLPRQIFEKQTIAELALVAGRVEETLAEQGTVTGESPLAPFQREFFNWNLARPDHFNQSVLLGLNIGADSRLLEQAVLALLSQHDVLRTSFGRAGEHSRQIVQAAMPDGIYERVGLMSSGQEQDSALEREIARAQATLDLSAGRLMKAIEFDLGAERGKRLLLVIHHLVVDGVSWRILVDDLERGYGQLKAGQQIDLGLKTTSFKQWAERLEAYTREDELQREVEYWSSLTRTKVCRLPVEFDQNQDQNLFATQNTVTANLSEEETRALLQDVPGVYNTQINDALLTVLARVLGQESGSDVVLIDVEGHGREEIFPDIDLSRTVGWFTVSYPVALEAQRGTAWHPGKALTRIKEQLRSVPNRGLGYGVLRQLSEERRVRDRVRNIPKAEVIFNYLGQVDQVLRKSELLYPVEEHSGVTIAPENRRPYILDVSGVVIQGRLQMNWNFSDQLHQRQTIEEMAARYMESLRELINHCRSEGAGGYTPSDFPVAEMTRHDLAQIASLLGD